MTVGFSGIEKVDSATVVFGYEGGAYASVLKLTDDVVCSVVPETGVDICCAGMW